MNAQARQQEASPTDSVLDTDLCIIGAGPAGIALGLECVGAPFRVDILESGRFHNDHDVQALSAGTVRSSYYTSTAIEQGRHRQFGGTSNKWAYQAEPGDGRIYARCLPPEAIDFEARPGVNGDGWPFALEELGSSYTRAQSIWNGGRFEYDVESWSDAASPPLPTRGDIVRTRICQHGSRDVFTFRYRDDLEAAENVTVHPGWTVLRLESDTFGSRIVGAVVRRSDGSSVIVRAKVVVLAAGGVENVQLLLLTDATKPGGPGNQHDNIGRYATDHIEFRMGTIVPSGPEMIDLLSLYDIRRVGRYLVSGMLTIAESVKRQEGLLNLSAVLVPQTAGFGSSAHRSIATLRAARNSGPSLAMLSDLGALLRAPRETAEALRLLGRTYHEYHGGWSRPGVERSGFRAVEIHAAAEQSPERQNRITLSTKQDHVGRRRPCFESDWSLRDRDNVTRSVRILGTEIEDSGIGRYRQWVDFEGRGRPVATGYHHPMGGTRMHPDPALGVVDATGRVHGIENLYVVGSSAFSNGHGYANPTLTILALSVRLATHLKSTLR